MTDRQASFLRSAVERFRTMAEDIAAAAESRALSAAECASLGLMINQAIARIEMSFYFGPNIHQPDPQLPPSPPSSDEQQLALPPPAPSPPEVTEAERGVRYFEVTDDEDDRVSANPPVNVESMEVGVPGVRYLGMSDDEAENQPSDPLVHLEVEGGVPEVRYFEMDEVEEESKASNPPESMESAVEAPGVRYFKMDDEADGNGASAQTDMTQSLEMELAAPHVHDFQASADENENPPTAAAESMETELASADENENPRAAAPSLTTLRVVSGPGHPVTLPAAAELMSPGVTKELAVVGGYQMGDLRQLRKMTEVMCMVSHVEQGAEEFYVVPEEWMKQLEDLTDLLQELVPKLQQEQAELPVALRVGMACLCPDGGYWYRAKVERVLGSHSAKVRFVDFGNSSFLFRCEEFLPIPKKAADVPLFAIRCSAQTTNPPVPDANAFKRQFHIDNDQALVSFSPRNDAQEPCEVTISSYRKA